MNVIANAKSFKSEAAWQRFCQAPDCKKPTAHNWQAHHVVYEQHIRPEGGEIWDPRNVMRLCRACHGAHHERRSVLPVSAISDENLLFARDLFGAERAAAYFSTYYDGDAETVLARLEAL